MGQLITVESDTVGDVAIFATDRSVTGQDGVSCAREGQSGDTPPQRLAAGIFDADEAIEHVFVASNGVTVRRSGGWPEPLQSAVADVIRTFFLFYRE